MFLDIIVIILIILNIESLMHLACSITASNSMNFYYKMKWIRLLRIDDQLTDGQMDMNSRQQCIRSQHRTDKVHQDERKSLSLSWNFIIYLMIYSVAYVR